MTNSSLSSQVHLPETDRTSILSRYPDLLHSYMCTAVFPTARSQNSVQTRRGVATFAWRFVTTCLVTKSIHPSLPVYRCMTHHPRRTRLIGRKKTRSASSTYSRRASET